jgi:hypothetical protein
MMLKPYPFYSALFSGSGASPNAGEKKYPMSLHTRSLRTADFSRSGGAWSDHGTHESESGSGGIPRSLHGMEISYIRYSHSRCQPWGP